VKRWKKSRLRAIYNERVRQTDGSAAVARQGAEFVTRTTQQGRESDGGGGAVARHHHRGHC